ncbi:MAG: M28 family peptidase [Planctomycetes bacterium]|nr:M28 family peptidase [Planctomycetota bacterium]
MRPLVRPFVFAFAVAPLLAQQDSITELRVRETVAWLADDARGGRASGSPELEQVADWIIARFEAAGLQPVRSAFAHDFVLPGLALDSGAVQLLLQRTVDGKTTDHRFEPGKQVRQWTASDVVEGDVEPCTVATFGDRVLQLQIDSGSARRPLIVEVDEQHPYWLASRGVHQVLGKRRRAARPVLLVPKGLLPANPPDGREVGWTATWSVAPAEKGEVAQRNVLALLPGTTKKDEYVLVSAHYDHIGKGSPVGGDHINNGADDDASGTTAVILLAEAMAKMPPPARSVLFVCFAAEERNLLGSAAFAERPPVPLEQVVANLNIEMIGRPLEGNEGKAWITGRELSDFAAIAAEALGRGGVQVVDFPLASRLFAQSDNFSLARRGVVAHSISAGSLHEDYHQPGDEVAKLDLPHMTKIIRGLLELTLELANREAAPLWNEKGKQQIERLRR